MEKSLTDEPILVKRFLVRTDVTGQPREIREWNIGGERIFTTETLIRHHTSQVLPEELARETQEIYDVLARVRKAQERGNRVSLRDALIYYSQQQLSQELTRPESSPVPQA